MLTLHEMDYLQSSITAHQGGTWTIDSITNSVTVTASDLDIRNLLSSQDSVEIKTAAGQALAIDGSGYITANINGTVTVSSTNLDIRDLSSATDSVSTVDQSFNSWKTSKVSVTNTATQITAAPLTGRKRIIIQNVGDKDIYVKDANTVSSSVDGKIAKGASFEMNLGTSATIYAITASGTADIRVWEFAV
jgi:hypothetical protein